MKYEELDQAFDPRPTDKKTVCVCERCKALWIEYVNGCPKCEKGHVVCRPVTKEEFEELKNKQDSCDYQLSKKCDGTLQGRKGTEHKLYEKPSDCPDKPIYKYACHFCENAFDSE